MDCGSICASKPPCSAFSWDMSLKVCKLAEAEKMGGPDLYPVPGFVDASKNLCKF